MIWKTIRSNRFYMLSIIYLTLIILFALFAFLLPQDPNQTDISNMYGGVSLTNWFGTDELGRDYFTRVVYGSRVSLMVGVLAMLTSTFIGTFVGVTSGYFGGWLDAILMRIVDILSSIPWTILIVVASLFFTPGLNTIILVIGLFSWMRLARLIRAEILSVKERDFVIYSQFIGESHLKIIFRHILPSVIPTLTVAASSSVGNAIMTESALSFLGLGIQQPLSSWGSLLQNAQTALQRAPLMAFIPGILIILTVLSFNQIGNLVRDLILRYEHIK